MCLQNCTCFSDLGKKKKSKIKKLGARLEEKSMHCSPSLDQFLAVRNIPFFQSFSSSPFPSFLFRGEELRDGTASPLGGLVLHQYP